MQTSLYTARVKHVMLGTADNNATRAWWTVPGFPGMRLEPVVKRISTQATDGTLDIGNVFRARHPFVQHHVLKKTPPH